MALPLIVAGIAARAAAKKVATSAAKKAVASRALKAASAKNQSRGIAKNSVKKVSYAEKEAKALEKPKKQFVKEVNQFRDKTTKARKSGKLAAEVAKKKTIPRENLMFPPDKVKINSATKNSKTTTKSNYKTPSLAKTQAKGIAKLAGAGVATGAFTQVPAVKQSIKRQVEEANKNKKRK